jgi:hypothetical protein
MRISWQGLILCLAVFGPVVLGQSAVAQRYANDRQQAGQAGVEQLFALANQSRAAKGAGPLRWDPALAAAALQHCRRMAAEGPISHRYGGELDLTARAGQAGAHFSLIEENVAVGSYPATIHQGWMDSPGHRSNLLNPQVDRVGIAVVAANGVIYAVADYARAVQTLSPAQVEATIAGILQGHGIMVLKDPTDARAYCSNGAKNPSQPGFLMRWQNPDLTQLPQALMNQIASGRYRKATVGSCPPQNVEGAFTTYRVAVLLY